MPATLIDCIYCGLKKPGSREHVVQDALGGVDVLTDVCGDCNSLLSVNDRVLTVESPLSIFVRRELSGVGPNSWDVDCTRDGLLLEARTTPGTDSMTFVPQLIFDGDEQLIYCDSDDIIRLGKSELNDRLYIRLRRAYGHFRIHGPNARKRDHKGQDMLKLSPIERIRSGYRLPARICCNQRVSDFGSDAIMFYLRYLIEHDRDRVLDMLSKFDWSKRAKELRLQLGSDMPEFHIKFCLTHAVQAITKVGFNLLAFFCKSTPVNRMTFLRTIEWITEGKHTSAFGDACKFGFIEPAGVAELVCPPKSHKFRLTHDPTTNTWKMYASFFEGKAAACVNFTGPNNENWATMDVVAPYDRRMLAPSSITGTGRSILAPSLPCAKCCRRSPGRPVNNEFGSIRSRHKGVNKFPRGHHGWSGAGDDGQESDPGPADEGPLSVFDPLPVEWIGIGLFGQRNDRSVTDPRWWWGLGTMMCLTS
jgi:hypothetical protein